MSKRPPKFSEKTIKDILREIHILVDTPPKGFHTLDDWAKIWKVSRSTAFRYVETGLGHNLMSCRKFRVKVGKTDCPRLTDHYGPPSKANKGP